MSTRVRNAARRPTFPVGVVGFIRRRAEEALGLALGLAGLTLFVALATYDAADSSLNTASGGAPGNWMGKPGAIAADLLIQSVGIAGVLLALVLTVWGWRLVRHRHTGRYWIRIVSLPLTLLLASVALAGLTPIVDAPLQASWGGATGEILLTDLSASMVVDLGIAAWLTPAIAGLLASAALIAALGLSLHEWGAVLTGLGRAGASGARAGIEGGKRGANAGSVMASMFRRWREAARNEREFAEVEQPRQRQQDDREETARREPTLDAPRSAPQSAPGSARTDIVQAKPVRTIPAPKQASLKLQPATEYDFPPLEELDPPPPGIGTGGFDEIALEENARLLETVLQDFGVKGQIVKVRPGPVVTLYELEPAPGTKSSRVIGLADDIARSMSAVSVRVAVIPGRNVIGIELPNARREIVYLRELLASSTYDRTGAHLALALGKDIGGTPVIGDLARMPHLLIAGTTGAGKSVAINTMILSLLYRLSPERCKFIMIDPKMLELSVYDGIPHLLAPVVTDPKEAVTALRWAVREMENRYRAMSNLGVRNIAGYNTRLAEARKRGEELTRTVQTGFDPATGQPMYEQHPLDMESLPFIVVIVDEMADLMLVAGKEVEAAVQRLAQMARAAGIHLIMATQRPSVDVITGTIKANFPTRISFQVTSKIDSRTILGESGAEQLLGQGDMLYMTGGGRITRVHGPLVTDDEVERVVTFLRDQGAPDYLDEVTDEDAQAGIASLGLTGGGDSGDELYDRAVALVCRERKASTSFIQRHLQIGYNRAARIIEQMETDGVVSRANHVGKREVLARDIEDIDS